MGLFHEYRLIGDPEAGKARLRWGADKIRVMCFLVLVVLLCGMAFAAGRYQSPPPIPLATRPLMFEYDGSFQDEKSPLTDEKWKGLFPQRKGFFQHPSIADRRSALAVFHQLHCLNGIRQGYWALYDIASSNQDFPGDEHLPHMSSPPHIRHCLELLRLALMCQPDLTVELKNETLGGVTGFGTEHQCKRWEDLSRWIAQWESYGLDASR